MKTKVLLLIAFSSSCTHFESTNPCKTPLKEYPQLETFIKDMPKGADLHSHVQGACYPEDMLEFIKNKPYFYDPKTQEALSEQRKDSIPLKDVLNQPALKYELLKAWSVLDYKGDNGHDHFFNAFGKFKAISATYALNDFLIDILQKAKQQKVSYLEIMVNPIDEELRSILENTDKTLKLDNEKDFENLHTQFFKKNVSNKINNIKNIIDKTELYITQHLSYNPLKISEHNPINLRFIYQAPRNAPRDFLFGRLFLGFYLASVDERFVGVTLVVPEDGEIPIKDYDVHMKMFNFLHKIYPQASINLHAGEVTEKLISPNKTRLHIRKAIEIAKSKRIGHGVNIKQDPAYEDLLKQMSEQKLFVEINLSSNAFILDVKGKEHPLRLYLDHKVPVGLSTDDAGVLRTDMTKEYLRAVREQNLSYLELKNMARNTLQFNFINGESLWTKDSYEKKVSVCETDSEECSSFLQKNPKAQLQWNLERDFQHFEAKHCNE